MESALAFGKVLRKWRKARGLSQERLALEAGLERVFISLLENGLRQPTLQTLLKLARVLECGASQLVQETENLLTSGEAPSGPAQGTG